MEWRGSLRYVRRTFHGAFMKRCGSSGWGFPWKLGGIYFVRIKFPLDCAFYIRHLGRIILLHLQTPELCRNSKFFFFFFPSWTKNAAWILDVTAEAKEAEAKDFPTFQLGKKEDSLPSTRDRGRRRLRQALDEPPNANQECAGVG